MDVIGGLINCDRRSITTIILLSQLIICGVFFWVTDIVIDRCRLHGDEKISNLAWLDCYGKLHSQRYLRLLD